MMLSNVCCSSLLSTFSSLDLQTLLLLLLLSRFSRVQLSATLWTMACQAPLSVGFFRQDYWGGLPFPSPNLIVLY